jgi:hypothetical protein
VWSVLAAPRTLSLGGCIPSGPGGAIVIGRGSYRSVLRMLGGTTVVIHLAACSEPEKSFTPQPADPGPAPTVLVNPRLLTLMQGQSAEVSVDGALEYEWMNLPPSGITVRPSAPENFRLEAWATVPAGTYRLMVSGRNCYHYGCTRDGVDTLTLIIESANGFPFSWDFCAGSRVAWFALRDGRDAPWVEVPVVGGGVDFELS